MPVGIYLHIPFCRIKCPYCDFNTYAGIEGQIPRYLASLEAELSRRLADSGHATPVATVYFGGGTPSLLDADDIASLIDLVRTEGRPVEPMEVTLEANPGTIDRAKLRDLRSAGVNRLTVGVQTFQPPLLERLARLHDVAQSRMALADARSAGFEQLNLDLMFGLSGQTLDLWEADLEAALAQEPSHLSLYNLTIEPGTSFDRAKRAGRLPLPDEEACRAMYGAASERTAAAGFTRYEVSNFARPGSESLHNRIYWDGSPYLGVGAGAHGFTPAEGPTSYGRRWWNHRVPRLYCEAVEEGRLPEEGEETIDWRKAVDEALLLGLRTSAGLDLARFEDRLGVDARALMEPALNDALQRDLVVLRNNSLQATEAGVIILDSLISKLAAAVDRTLLSDTLNSARKATVVSDMATSTEDTR